MLPWSYLGAVCISVHIGAYSLDEKKYILCLAPFFQEILRAPSRGVVENLPFLNGARVYVFPKNTTWILQPLDAVVIACIKKRLRNHRTKRAVNLLDAGSLTNFFYIELDLAISWIHHILVRIQNDFMRNYWLKINVID